MAKTIEKDEEDKRETALAAWSGNSTSLSVGEDEMEGLTGLGYSEKSEDGLVPVLSILQDPSGEVKKGHSRRIDGAEAGHLIIRSIGRVIDPSKELVVVQPCAFLHVWQAWLGEPGEGVPTGTYPFDDIPKDAVEVTEKRDDGSDIKVLKMPDGSYLVDTRQHYGYIMLNGVWRPIVIPMAGTNHKPSRLWTEAMKAIRLPGTTKPAPAWFRGYSVDTKFNQRGQQSWHTYEFKDNLGFIQDPEQRKKGREMFEALQAGTIQADVNSEAGVGSEGKPESEIPI